MQAVKAMHRVTGWLPLGWADCRLTVPHWRWLQGRARPSPHVPVALGCWLLGVWKLEETGGTAG